MALIELNGIDKYYGEGEVALHVLKDVDLSFEKFPAFLEARAALIKQRLTDLLS